MDIENKNKLLLFKFTPVNLNVIRLLVNSEIWFSSFNKLNDPYEGKFEIEKMELPNDEILFDFYKNRSSFKFDEDQIEKRIIKIKKDLSLFYKDLEIDLRNSYFNKLKVACFSLIYNEILLWSHYADEHKGICLIFDKNVLIGNGSFEESEYPADYIEHNIVRYKNRNKLKLSFCQNKKLAISLENDKEVVFNKLDCWVYEKEYRFFSKESFAKKSDGMAFKFSKKALQGVIFGERCSHENIALIHSILNNYGYIDTYFFWGASRIVPTTGKLVTIKKYGEIDLYEILYSRNKWLQQNFD